MDETRIQELAKYWVGLGVLEENGIWVRGAHDYANPRVAGAIGTGRNPTLTAWIGDATWAERRIALVDAVAQVQKVRAESWLRVVTFRRALIVRYCLGQCRLIRREDDVA